MKCSDCKQYKTAKCESNPTGEDHEPVEQLRCFVSKHSKDILRKQLLQNTSGQAKASAIPPEVKGWNWGAFLLPLVWGIYHGVWLSLLLFVPIINFFTAIVFGADGNKWAWQNRKWDSIEHFKRTQRMWALWGILLFLFTIILLIIFGFLAVGTEEYATSTIPSSASSNEQAYRVDIEAVIDRFYDHRTEYNTGVERLGALFSTATTEAKQRIIIQQLIGHLENCRQWFSQDRDDFALILPPEKFREAHLLMNSVLNDYVAATTSFITYYSINLSSGTRDLQTANRASELLRTANENLQRAAYMYASLSG